MIVTMPRGITFEEAAACLEGAVYAGAQINFLKSKPDQKALVYGATGANGLAYLQFLNYYGTSTPVVRKGENAGLVISLGAAKIIDYAKDDFTRNTERYDFIFDAVGKTSFFKCKKLLKENGIYSSSGSAENLALMMLTPLVAAKRWRSLSGNAFQPHLAL